MKIFVSAAEISSDIHAEKIIRSLLAKLQQQKKTIQIAGIGGPRLRSIPGFECIERAENLRAMGFTEILGKLFKINSILNETAYFIKNFEPDLILTFDYPDFHLRLMKKIQTALPHALKICGIPPKVWVWRSHRVEQIRALYDGVWVIFPFEKDFYENHGIPVIFEGNPLVAALVDGSRPAKKLFDESGALLLTVMPGSREAELKLHLPIIPETLNEVSRRLDLKVHALVPVPEGLSLETFQKQLQSNERVTYEFRIGGSKQCLEETEIGLIKSGTSTLESAILGCVPVIFYKVSVVSGWIFKLFVKYLGPVGLPNILLGIKVRSAALFPEFLGVDANPNALATEIVRLVSDKNLLREKQKAGDQLFSLLVPKANQNGSIGDAIADRLLQWTTIKPYKSRSKKGSVLISFASVLWSSLNWFRRRLRDTGLIPSKATSAPSVLVGNIQAGGTGKTPIVIELAKEAVRRNLKVAILSRGYRSKAESEERVLLAGETATALEIGDEPVEIRNAVPEAILGVGRDRVKVLAKLPPVDLILFDDGFQNLKFKATTTVLLKTKRSASEIPYRDFSTELKYADLVLQKEDLVWVADTVPKLPVWIFCAVGNPDEVAAFYSKQGFRIDRLIAKPDHAQFRAQEVNSLMKQASAAGALLAVTEKDFAKLREMGFEHYGMNEGASLVTADGGKLLLLKRNLVSKEWIATVFERLQRAANSDKLYRT